MAMSEKQPLLAEAGSVGGEAVADARRAKPLMSKTMAVVLYYAACSSLMLVVNKLAVHNVQAPTFVLLSQLLTSAVVVKGLAVANVVEVDALEWTKIKAFVWVILGFVGCVFANIKVLQNSNVETFITFRSSTPIILSFCDYIFLGRALPNAKSWGCLTVLLLGAFGYVLTDSDFRVEAYLWLAIWYAFFTFDCVYVKHMCDTVKMTNWGRVYYTNFGALVPMLFVLPALGEHHVLMNMTWTASAVVPLLLACAIGVGMSHASYLLRENVSATYFTIVGIVCKIVTVLINMMIWDKHASAAGIGFLLVCVLAGTLYEQAPKRPAEGAKAMTA